jgi:hypothetical protein
MVRMMALWKMRSGEAPWALRRVVAASQQAIAVARCFIVPSFWGGKERADRGGEGDVVDPVYQSQ